MVAPEREWIKAADVCDAVGVPAYVLRSWEAEFPQLGQGDSGGGARLYGPDDVELVRQIRTLVFDEGLTLAGVRRQLEGLRVRQAPTPRPSPAWDPETRARVKAVRDGLRELLGRLDTPAVQELELVPSVSSPRRKGRTRRPSGGAAPVVSE